MKFSKEFWWEYLLETDLKDLSNKEEELEVLKQVFYCGYICRQSEDTMIRNELERLKNM